jgi:hypothetical protein
MEWVLQVKFCQWIHPSTPLFGPLSLFFNPSSWKGGLLGYAKIGDKTKLGIEIGLDQSGVAPKMP